MAIEMTPQVKSRVWWHGALKSAIKGIPQGIVLGAVAAVVLFGIIGAMCAVGGPIGLMGLHAVHSFAGFVYSQSALTAIGTGTGAAALHAALPTVLSFHSIGFLPIVMFNTVLTAVGNFITGGKIALGDYQQKVDHANNEARLDRLEGKAQMIEQGVAGAIGSQKLQQIVAQGPRTLQGFAAMEEARATQAAAESKSIH